MKKILIAYGVLILIVGILAFAKFKGANLLPNFGGTNKSTVTINDHKYEVEIAKDEKTKQKGLSGRKNLDQNKGMIFLFDKKGKYSFWMKDTLIPLDMIFINNDKIVYIVKNAPPQKSPSEVLPVYTTPKDANYVLEINGGQSDKNKFKEGDKIILSNIK